MPIKKQIIDGIVKKHHPDWLQKQDVSDSEYDDTGNQEKNHHRVAMRLIKMGRLDFLYRMDLLHRAISVYISI